MGTNSPLTRPDELRLDVLPDETQKAFVACTSFDFLQSDNWYLAGGTGLALQVGHRRSFDLDFFTEKKDFEVTFVERLLLEKGDWVTTHSDRGTLYGLFKGAKMSFIAYPFFRPSSAHVQCGTVRILVPDDIAAMKIVALSQRGKKRDFVDLYWYGAIHKGSLTDTLQRTVAQYPDKKHSLPHFIKSLAYFADAEEDPMPQLFFEATWDSIKKYFERAAVEAAREMLL